MHLNYMAAAIRLLVRQDDPSLWSPDQIVETFALLPKQQVGYREWLSVIGGDVSVDESITLDDPVERLKGSHLVQSGIVTIEESAKE